MIRKTKDLQPWLDYFSMLQKYEENGYLEVVPDKHEAYVTQPALHAMTEGENPQEQVASGAVLHTVKRLRAYTGWLSREGKEYMDRPFAVHVVKDTEPHDVICTLLMTRTERRWRNLWQSKDKVEVISYE